ncbi:MAG: hypothetical protein ABFS32_22080 [Bacteroidota bacterium]
MKKRYLLILSLVLITTLFVVGLVSAGPPAKVEVCHLTSSETNTYVLITISENAFQIHVDHGDASPHEYVPGMPGYAFDSECVPYQLMTDTLFVNGFTGAVVSTFFNTKPGVMYRLDASGAFNYRGGTTPNADAKCSFRLPGFWHSFHDNLFETWVDGATYFDGDPAQAFGLQVAYWNGTFGKPISPVGWGGGLGVCNPLHEYTAYFVGDGAPISLYIYDNVYSDNSVGPITIVISEIP